MKKRIAIIGAGAAGLTLAWKLLNRNDLEIDVKIIEKEPIVGGAASGFEHEGLNLDFGSHKLHPETPPDILKDIRDILGNDLLSGKEKSRLHFSNRYVPVPLSAKGLITYLPFSFAAGIIRNSLAGHSKQYHGNSASYAEILTSRLGSGLCKSIYFPYMEKVHGLNPAQLFPLPINYMPKEKHYDLPQDIPLAKNRATEKYYYPMHGFLQLFEEMMRQIWKKGGKFLLMQKFTRLTRSSDGCLTCLLADGSRIDFDTIFSTIPLTDLINNISQIYPDNVTEIISDPLIVPGNVQEAARQIQYRHRIYCYLILNTGQYTAYNAHYFPEPEIIFSKISEPKNFNSSLYPDGKTALCAEIPCSAHDDIWNKDDTDIISRVTADMEKAGMPVEKLIMDTVVRRIENVCMQYDRGLADRLKTMEDYLHTIPDLVVLPRQGFTGNDFLLHNMEAAYRTAAGSWGQILSSQKQK